LARAVAGCGKRVACSIAGRALGRRPRARARRMSDEVQRLDVAKHADDQTATARSKSSADDPLVIGLGSVSSRAGSVSSSHEGEPRPPSDARQHEAWPNA
jgi:hypothetical protein